MELVHVMKKGRSNIPEATFVCKMLFALCLQGYHIVTTKLEHVPTDVNPADAPSRLQLPLSQAVPFFVSPKSIIIAFIASSGHDWNRRHHYRSFTPFVERDLFTAESAGWCTLQVATSPPVHLSSTPTPRLRSWASSCTPEFEAAWLQPQAKTIYRAEADTVQ